MNVSFIVQIIIFCITCLIISWYVYNLVMTRKKYYLLCAVLSISILSCVLSYWPHYFREYKLIFLGADLSGANGYEILSTVNEGNMDEAEAIYNTLWGVGWQVSAFFWAAFVFLPFSIVISVFSYVIKKLKTKN